MDKPHVLVCGSGYENCLPGRAVWVLESPDSGIIPRGRFSHPEKPDCATLSIDRAWKNNACKTRAEHKVNLYFYQFIGQK